MESDSWGLQWTEQAQKILFNLALKADGSYLCGRAHRSRTMMWINWYYRDIITNAKLLITTASSRNHNQFFREVSINQVCTKLCIEHSLIEDLTDKIGHTADGTQCNCQCLMVSAATARMRCAADDIATGASRRVAANQTHSTHIRADRCSWFN